MQIDPKSLSFWKLITDRLFRIPAYQRAYSWGSKQRQDLFEDLVNLYKKGHDYHFMATVVGLVSDKKSLGTDEFDLVDVVDGQQRLTTLVLLLKAIERALPEGKDKTALEEQLCKQDDHTLLLLQMNHDYQQQYTRYIRDGILPDKNQKKESADYNLLQGIQDVEAFVKDEWQKETGADTRELLALIKNKLFFLYHQLAEEKLVYTVFEVLNSRGLPVAWLDRTKAMLMGVVFEKAANPDEMIHELHGIWGDIYQEIGLIKSMGSEALRFAATLWLNKKENRVLSEADSLEVFRESALKQTGNAIKISQSLLEVTRLLKKLHEQPEKTAVTKIAHARLLAVVLMRDFPKDKQLLEQWERVTFRIYGLFSKDSRTKVGEYVRLATRINKGEPKAQQVMAELVKLGQGYSAADAAEFLREVNCYEGWQEELRYFFYARERWLEKQRKKKASNAKWQKIWAASAANTIEHIYPQKPEPGSWQDLIQEAENPDAEGLCHWLGNLTLLPPKVNSSIGRECYSEKAKTYREQGLLILDEQLKQAPKTWTMEAITQREEELISWAAENWADVSY